MVKTAQITEANLVQHHLNFRELGRQILPWSSDMELSESDVHLWKVSLDLRWDYINELYSTLDAAEQRKVNSCLLVKQRTCHIISFGILRKILGNYLKMNPAEISFKYGKNGKPTLGNVSSNKTIHFNLSNSNNLVVIALSRYNEIGVDIEYIEDVPEIGRVANQYFSKAEADVFQALPVYQKTAAFYNCWTRKQAFLKAIGNGSPYPLNAFDVSLAPEEPAQLLQVHGKPQEASQWSIEAITPGLNYTGAIAARNYNFQVKVYEDWHQEYSEDYQLAA